MDLALLVLVLDLIAAQLHADITLAAVYGDSLTIASTAVAQGQVAGRPIARIEVLVEPVLRRDNHRAGAPVTLHHLGIAVLPECAEAVAIQNDHVGSRPVAMRLLIGSDLELGDVRAGAVFTQLQANVAATAAALLPAMKRE